MSDAMISARMPQAKKDAGNQVLSQMGMTASQFINSAYDYLIQYGTSPFVRAEDEEHSQKITPKRIAQALAQIDEMCLPPSNRFAAMNDDDIKRERLVRQGFEGR